MTAPRTIDIHFHAIPPAFVAACRSGALREAIDIDAAGAIAFHAPPGVAIEPGLRIRPAVYEPGLILQSLDRLGLDAAAVSVPPEFFCYWAPPEAGERIARLVNDGYAAWAGEYPGQLIPLATVPLQDPDRAVAELRRAVDRLGLRGVAICSHVNGIDLDEPRFAPFFAAVEQLRVPLFLHPQNAGDVGRLESFHLWNLIGFPAETATAAARLILSGLFARHPALAVVLAHGGGFLPYQLGRLDHGWRVRPGLNRACPEPPSHYLRNLWFDCIVHDPAALAFLVQRAGEDHVLLGTDHPFDMGDTAPLDSLRRAGLSETARQKIAGGSLAGLLRLTS